jgi:predicted AAA+ superfamily ATPase
MAHLRKRFATTHLEDALAFSPLVGVLGQRQVGKTTLVESLVTGQYVSFDDEATKTVAELAPRQFLEQFDSLSAIDECQKVPGIFPALKLCVQKNKRPGQFLLTGSVRFTSRKAIQESLTGRVYNVEILPLSVAEMNEKPLADFVKWTKLSASALTEHIERRTSWFNYLKMNLYLSHGGLPGICFLRKESHRNAKFAAQIQTLLQRDIRLVFETTTPYQNLLLLLRFIARNQGGKFVIKDASRFSGISEITVKKTIFAFESLFLIRRIRGSGDVVADRFYFEDQGMARYLSKESVSSDDHLFAYSQLFAAAHYSHMNEMELNYFETKGGAKVPFVFSIRENIYGFLLNESEALTQSTIKSAKALFDRSPKAQIYILSRGNFVRRVMDRVTQIPLLGVI